MCHCAGSISERNIFYKGLLHGLSKDSNKPRKKYFKSYSELPRKVLIFNY